MDRPDRLACEQSRGLPAGGVDTAGNVSGCFRQLERRNLASERDALLQLTQSRFVQPLCELRLAREDQQQQLLGRRLDVREQPDLLEQLAGEALRLVDDEHGDLA